jgi:peptidoglycan/LPS O-acetylase OafA/YrhL
MGRQNNFDALRLAGALTVLVGHQFAIMGLPTPVVIGFKHIATVAVYVFFAISGYLVAASWQRDPHPIRYMARRALRMAPGWAVLMVLTAAAMLWLGADHFSETPLAAFNGSLWTLEWEILCYLVLAVLALILPLRIACLLATAVLLLTWRYSVLKNGPELGLMFCAGVMLSVFPVRRWWLLAIGVVPLLWIVRSEPYLVLLMTVPALSIWVGTCSWPGVRDVGRFGDYSYGIYIYAFPIQQFGVLLLGADRPYWVMLAISAAVTGVFAVLSWHWVELPGLSLKKFLERRQQRSSPGVLTYAAALTGSSVDRRR